MKKYTNKILIITFILFLLLSTIDFLVDVYKIKKGTKQSGSIELNINY